MRTVEKVDVCKKYFPFPTESPTSEKKIGADTLVSSFRMYCYCTKKSNLSVKNGHIHEKKSRKRIGVLCGSNYISLQHFFFVNPIYYPRTTLAVPPSSNSDPG